MIDSTRMMPQLLSKAYYYLKPSIPRRLQIELRRLLILYKLDKYRDRWPIDERAAEQPDGWKGWPDKKKFSLILTHDVESANGQEKCHQLISSEKALGFRSSFNFVPRRYNVSSELRCYLTDNGFEVGVHGLYHDGKYYNSREIFKERATQINNFLKEWKAVGFRSPSMVRNLEWIHDLNIEYDASTFDTDPFEPQPHGVSTIFPFWISQNDSKHKGYVELPYTLPQDFTLFILMKEKTIDIWKRKIDWIVENGGMVLVNTHPDYMSFDGETPNIEEYPAEYYIQLLEYIKRHYEGMYWHVLPKDMAGYWRQTIANRIASVSSGDINDSAKEPAIC